MRENRDYHPSEEKLAHIQEVFQLLNVMDRDHRFEQKQNEAAEGRGEAKTMSEWLSRVIDESEARGEAKGRAEGGVEGTIRTLWGLVNDHLIDIDVASARAHMSVAEFEQKAKALMAEESAEYQP